MEPTEEERDLAREARVAWAAGDPERAAQILEGYLAEHPERREVLLSLRNEDADERATLPFQPVECLRCGERVERLDRMKFHEGSAAREVFLGEWFVHRPGFDVYACDACGHVELFLPDSTRVPEPVRRRGPP